MAWARRRAQQLWDRRSPWHLAVALPVLVNLVIQAPQLTAVEPLNDWTHQSAMVRWAAGQFAGGHLPLDGWFPLFSLGNSQFHHYQSLPAILTASVSGPLGPTTTFLWVQYLLLCFWPVAIYFAARLLDRDVAQACVAALLCPLLASVTGYGYEQSSYVWQGLGLSTQLWGMWLLPLAWGFSWRAIEGRGRLLWAALFVALVICCHFISAYLALAVLPVMWLCRRDDGRIRLMRAATIGAAGLLMSAWVLVPLLGDSAYAATSDYLRLATFQAGSFTSAPGAWYDSFGFGQVMKWLLQGQLYDANPLRDGMDANGAVTALATLPIISLLVATGAVVMVVRRRVDVAGRALLGMWLVSLLLFSGPATFGFLRWLPGSDQNNFHRYLIGLHLCGIFIAGTGAVAICRWIAAKLEKYRWELQVSPIPGLGYLVVIPAAFLLSAPAVRAVAYAGNGARLIAQQQQAETADEPHLNALLADFRQLGGGRVYAGAIQGDTNAHFGSEFKIGAVPLYEVLVNHDIPQVGFDARTFSLSTDTELLFNDSIAGPQGQGQYSLFNIRYVIQDSSNHAVPQGWTVIGSSGRFALWEVAATTYARVVDTIEPPLTADHSNLGKASAAFMASTDLANNLFHTVAFAGHTAAKATLPDPALATTTAGTVVSEQDDLDNGKVVTNVTASRTAVVLLSASYDNRWTATVDGRAVTPEMVAPSLVGVQVSAGSHVVEFRYASYPWYWLWFLVAALTIAVLTRFGRGVGKSGSRLSRNSSGHWSPAQ